jgi:predicted RNase H-like nuclease (RuvC/YqgF family)
MSRDFDKAQEMVVASMEYVKVLGFRIRRTEVQRDVWKQVAQSHDDEVIKLRQHVDALKAERDAERKAHGEYKERQREIFNGNQRLTAELAVIKDERNALRAECDDLRRGVEVVKGGDK